MAASLRELFEAQDGWSGTATYELEALADAKVEGELATLLVEVGSGELTTPGGDLYHLLDPSGIAYWSREVLEKLQAICQPAGLRTFFIDEGGGTYAFLCSNGAYALHHQRGLLERADDLATLFARVFERMNRGEEPFGHPDEPAGIEEILRQAERSASAPFEERIAGKADAAFAPYDPHVRWSEGDLMRHPREGRGIVVAVKTTMYVQVEFASGMKTLAHKGW